MTRVKLDIHVYKTNCNLMNSTDDTEGAKEWAENEPHRAINCPQIMYSQRTPRSGCMNAQSDQGLHSPLTESLDTTECMNWEQRSG